VVLPLIKAISLLLTGRSQDFAFRGLASLELQPSLSIQVCYLLPHLIAHRGALETVDGGLGMHEGICPWSRGRGLRPWRLSHIAAPPVCKGARRDENVTLMYSESRFWSFLPLLAAITYPSSRRPRRYGRDSPRCPRINVALGNASKTPALMIRSACVPASTPRPTWPLSVRGVLHILLQNQTKAPGRADRWAHRGLLPAPKSPRTSIRRGTPSRCCPVSSRP